MKSIALIILLPILISCQPTIGPDNGTDTNNTQSPILDIIWKVQSSDSLSGDFINEGVFGHNGIVWVTGPSNIVHQEFSLSGLDMNSGKKIKFWKHPTKWKKSIIFKDIKNNIAVFSTAWGIYCMDLDLNEIRWEIDLLKDPLEYCQEDVHIDGDYVYMPIYFGKFSYPDSAILTRVHIPSGKRESVYNFKPFITDRKWHPYLAKPAFWQDPVSGDSLCMIVVNYFGDDAGPDKSPTDFVCFNMRTKEIVWNQVAFTPTGTQLRGHPMIYKDNVLVMGDWSMYSYHIPTGKLNYRSEIAPLKPFPAFDDTQSLLIHDKVYLNAVSRDVLCLDAEDGHVIWHNNDASSTASENMLYYKDMLITASWGRGAILVLDGNTGKLLHMEKAGNNNSYPHDVWYDEASDMFFANSYTHVIAFKIKRP